MTRVLVVDDSRFIRTVVGDALTAAGYDVETASDGTAAIDAVDTVDPDVITMDVEMPGIGGIEAVERIMADDPTPILMLSAYTDEGADASMEALNRGAMAIMEKPDGTADRSLSELTTELVEAVADLASASTSALALAQTTAAAHRSRTRAQTLSAGSAATSGGADVSTSSSVTAPEGSPILGPTGRPDKSVGSWPDSPVSLEQPPACEPTIVIGASTGGPRIVEGLLRAIPRTLSARIIIVQHMPSGFTERFATRLDQTSAYTIREADTVDRVSGGEAVVAAGDAHLEVARVSAESVELERSMAPRIHGVRPSIDVTMESVAAANPASLIGVVCSGMGRDGARGIEAFHEAGGHTFAQDERTSPVFGIPKQAIETGAVDEVVPATELPDRIVAAATTSDLSTNGEN